MFIKGFEQLRKEMFEECGGKAAHLGELTSLNLNVPRGFTVLGNAYYHHLEVNGLQERINAIAETLDFDDFLGLEQKTSVIRDLIVGTPVPAVIRQQIVDSYRRLRQNERGCSRSTADLRAAEMEGEEVSTPGEDPFVAVRSSVAIRESAVSSFPGMMDTYHYIKGPENVVEKVRECWASVWSARAAFARHSKKLDHDKAVIAPTIQLMVNAEVAGVLFTVNPISGSHDEIVVESNWGLGETVVCGKYNSDLYILTKSPCFGHPGPTCVGSVKSSQCGTFMSGVSGAPNACVTIAKKKIAQKYETYVQAAGGGAETVEVPPERVGQATLSEKQVQELCRTVCLIEEHYGCHQDIEWAFEKDRLYILQARRAKAGGN